MLCSRRHHDGLFTTGIMYSLSTMVCSRRHHDGLFTTAIMYSTVAEIVGDRDERVTSVVGLSWNIDHDELSGWSCGRAVLWLRRRVVGSSGRRIVGSSGGRVVGSSGRRVVGSHAR
jgi:hypothetical protein